MVPLLTRCPISRWMQSCPEPRRLTLAGLVLLHISMIDVNPMVEAFEVGREMFDDRHRAMAPARAANGQRQCDSTVGFVLGQEHSQQF